MSRCVLTRLSFDSVLVSLRAQQSRLLKSPSRNICNQLRAFIDGNWEVRSYTPIRFVSGRCEIFFRVYPAPEGTMSRYLQGLQKDDWIEMKGPVGDSIHRHELTSHGLSGFGGNRAQVFFCFWFSS